MTFPKDTTPSIDAETSRNKSVFGVVVDQTGKPRTHAQDRTLLRALRRGEPYHLFPMHSGAMPAIWSALRLSGAGWPRTSRPQC